MDDMRIGTLFAVLLPLLLVGEVVVGVALWRVTGHQMPGILRQPLGQAASHVGIEVRLVGAWIAISVASVWVGFLVAFVVVHLLLFTLGDGAAFVGLIASAVLLAAMPIWWAFVLFRRSRP